MDNPLIRSSLSVHGPEQIVMFLYYNFWPPTRPHHQPRIIYQSYPQMFHSEAPFFWCSFTHSVSPTQNPLADAVHQPSAANEDLPRSCRWMGCLFHGKSQNKMDDLGPHPHFRKLSRWIYIYIMNPHDLGFTSSSDFFWVTHIISKKVIWLSTDD